MVGVEWICNFVCRLSSFVICAEMLISLRVKEKYEKYLKVCLALMIAGMFLQQLTQTVDTSETEAFAMEEMLRELNEEEMEQAVDRFWEKLLLENQNEENPGEDGEGEEMADEG